MPPVTPLSAGVEAPPHSMSPGDGGQNFQQLHGLLGGATRVVMLRGEPGVRPAIGFGGQMLHATAMLVGGGRRTRPSPLYRMVDIVDCLKALRSPSAPFLTTLGVQIGRERRRLAHSLLRSSQGRVVRLPPTSEGIPRSGADLARESSDFDEALVDAFGALCVVLKTHFLVSTGDDTFPALDALLASVILHHT